MKKMKVKEFADLLGVSDGTLRNYDKKGILVPDKLPSGHRLYGERQIEQAISLGLLRREDLRDE